jgi:pimeloyl-ACP methyl ester carboxylesterase
MKHALQGIRVWTRIGLLCFLPFWVASCGTEMKVLNSDLIIPPQKIAEELNKTIDHLDYTNYHFNHSGQKVYEASNLGVFSELIAFRNEARAFSGAVKAVLTVSGGWNSCSSGQLFDRTAEFLRAELKRGVKYKIVASCYGKTSDSVYFLTSENVSDLIESTPAGLAQVIGAKTTDTESKGAFIVGHSHGGWLAMNLAWYLPKSATLKGLATLDPISKTNCTPYDVVGSYLRSQWSMWPHQGCIEAPSDFTAAELAVISKRAPFWQNFFQDSAPYLHSSGIHGAKNFYLYYEVNSILEIFDPHRSVDSDDRSWNKFGPLIAAG